MGPGSATGSWQVQEEPALDPSGRRHSVLRVKQLTRAGGKVPLHLRTGKICLHRLLLQAPPHKSVIGVKSSEGLRCFFWPFSTVVFYFNFLFKL